MLRYLPLLIVVVLIVAALVTYVLNRRDDKTARDDDLLSRLEDLAWEYRSIDESGLVDEVLDLFARSAREPDQYPKHRIPDLILERARSAPHDDPVASIFIDTIRSRRRGIE